MGFLKNIYIKQWFSSQGSFTLQGQLEISGDIFDYHNWWGRQVDASSFQ